MSEKRSFPRLPRNWDFEYQVFESESARPILIKGGIRDLSWGGFSFMSESAFPPEALLQFAINPTDTLMPMVGVARIAWTRGWEGVYENGARFLWVKWKGSDPQTAIAQYVLDNMSTRPS